MTFISNVTLYQLQQGSNTRNNCINCLKNIRLITSCSYGQSTETAPNQQLACHTADNSVASAAAQWLKMPPTQQCCRWHKMSKNKYIYVVCLTTAPQPLPKRVLHRVTSSASSFNFQYLLVSLRWSSSCLCLLPLLSITSIVLSFLQ